MLPIRVQRHRGILRKSKDGVLISMADQKGDNGTVDSSNAPNINKETRDVQQNMNRAASEEGRDVDTHDRAEERDHASNAPNIADDSDGESAQQKLNEAATEYGKTPDIDEEHDGTVGSSNAPQVSDNPPYQNDSN